MELDTYDIDGIRVIRILAPRIDAAESVRFKDAVRDAAMDGPERVVLDVSDVTFLDSSGLGAVVSTLKILAPNQKLELANLTPAVAKVFRLTRMDTIMTIHDSLPIAGGGPDDQAADRAHAL